jgi:hypothetical protein
MEQELEELLREDAPTDVAKIATILAEMKRIQSLHQIGGEYVGPGSSSGYQAGQSPADVYQLNGNIFDPSLGGAHGGNLHY